MITGIDIGGSHITVGAIDNITFDCLSDELIRERVDSHAAASEILDGWCNAIKALWHSQNVEAAPLAFAMPGPFDYKNGICLIKGFDKYEALYELNIREILSERLQVAPSDILFRNDAEAFIAGEAKQGAAKGLKHVIGLTLGTGLGSAIFHDGEARDAELSFSIHKEGVSIEEFISTRGLLRNYFKLTGMKAANVQEMIAANQTDTAVVQAFKLFSEDLIFLLEQFIAAEQPEMVVMGGNITEAWDWFMPSVIQSIHNCFPNPPQFSKALLGEQAAIIGAAQLFENR